MPRLFGGKNKKGNASSQASSSQASFSRGPSSNKSGTSTVKPVFVVGLHIDEHHNHSCHLGYSMTRDNEYLATQASKEIESSYKERYGRVPIFHEDTTYDAFVADSKRMINKGMRNTTAAVPTDLTPDDICNNTTYLSGDDAVKLREIHDKFKVEKKKGLIILDSNDNSTINASIAAGNSLATHGILNSEFIDESQAEELRDLSYFNFAKGKAIQSDIVYKNGGSGIDERVAKSGGEYGYVVLNESQKKSLEGIINVLPPPSFGQPADTTGGRHATPFELNKYTDLTRSLASHSGSKVKFDDVFRSRP